MTWKVGLGGTVSAPLLNIALQVVLKFSYDTSFQILDVVAPKERYPRSNFWIFQSLVKSQLKIWRSYLRNESPIFNRASDWSKIGGQSTRMDIGEFIDLLYGDNVSWWSCHLDPLNSKCTIAGDYLFPSKHLFLYVIIYILCYSMQIRPNTEPRS